MLILVGESGIDVASDADYSFSRRAILDKYAGIPATSTFDAAPPRRHPVLWRIGASAPRAAAWNLPVRRRILAKRLGGGSGRRGKSRDCPRSGWPKRLAWTRPTSAAWSGAGVTSRSRTSRSCAGHLGRASLSFPGTKGSGRGGEAEKLRQAILHLLERQGVTKLKMVLNVVRGVVKGR